MSGETTSSAAQGRVADRLTHPLVPAVAFAVAAVALSVAAMTGFASAGEAWVVGLLWLVFAANAGYAVSGSV